jgi:hypothetical protein
MCATQEQMTRHAMGHGPGRPAGLEEGPWRQQRVRNIEVPAFDAYGTILPLP